MFHSFSHLTCFLALLLLENHLVFVAAGPTLPQPSLVSIPLVRPTYAANAIGLGEYIHGSIIQQQNINRGIKRFASMTGRIPPSDYELLWIIHERISLLPAALQRTYQVEKIAKVLAEYHIPWLYQPTLGPKSRRVTTPSSFPVKRGAIRTAAALAYKPSLHNIGLDIESTDIGYMGTVQMGTPPRNFRLLIDSGSADLWVGAKSCRSDDGGGCGNHTFLGPHSSSSFNQSKEDWAIGYVSGSVWGYLVQDDVSIAGLTLKGHTFGVALNESSDFTSDKIPFDGLLGLGKSGISQQRVSTLLQSLRQANLIAAPIASYKLPRLADGRSNAGELTLGAMDPKHYYPRSLVKVKNVNKFGFWGVAVDAVKVGKEDMHWSNRTVVMDTGTTLIIAPKNDVDAIHGTIPGARYGDGGWMVPCNMTTIISLTIGGQAFTIDPRDVAFYPVQLNSKECVSGIGIGGVGPFYLSNEWLVGDVFLKNVYFSTNEDTDAVLIAKPRF
ncbi:aspartic peptidase domain-containing protein [Flammula alnicola]|nr:aspartic peptidase domain-containing protein [Flammula alnicola]